MNNTRKIAGYVLISLVLITTIIAILGIWGVIDYEQILRNLLLTLLVIFIASAVVLFITTVLVKDDQRKFPE